MKRKWVGACCAVAFIGVGSISAYAAVDAYEYSQASGLLGDIGIEVRELSRKDAKEVYKDIASDTYEYEKTMDLLNDRAQDLGIANIPADGKEIYEAIVHYHALLGTAKITSEQIRTIPTGLTYKEIIKVLGDTKDIGSGQHVLQYAVDGDKVLYLSFADENDKCMQSGEDLLKTLESKPQNHVDQNTFNATMTQRMDNSILVSCPTYERFDVISLAITKDTSIEFKDGSLATIDDIDSTSNLIITIGENIDLSYPPQGLALKIIINK
ncbi:MAG: hypothetical protein ACRDBX_05130 [Erysipelotrichaceae bacterium]